MAEKELSLRVNITLPRETLTALDNNVVKLREYLLGRGLDPNLVPKIITRSGLIKEMANYMSTPMGYDAIKFGFDTALGLGGQLDLFESQKQ